MYGAALFFGLTAVSCVFVGCLAKVKDSSLSYFFLLATVLRRPLRVLEFVLVRCPRTGKPDTMAHTAIGMDAD